MRQSEEEEEAEEGGGKGRKGKGGAAKKAGKSKGKAEEEGEISSDVSNQEFDDGLDENLIGDDEDRARLEQLTEREREEELFKRAETREKDRKKFEIKKRLKLQQKLAPKKPKDSSSDEGEQRSADQSRDFSDEFEANQMLDAKERSQDRKRNLEAQKFDKKSTALNELKAIKEERMRKEKERERRREAETKKKSKKKGTSDSDSSDNDQGRRGRRKERSRSSSSSSAGSYRRRSSSSSSSSKSRSSSSGGSDTERFKKASKAPKYVETQEDLEPIRLSRFKIERFLFLPHFRQVVTGCFVRIGIGQNSEGKSVYRCTEITDVVETAKVYSIGKNRTNYGLKLKFGKQERVFRLEFISNSPLLPNEFEKWKATIDENNMNLPTRDYVASKSAEVKKAIGYEYSSADVDTMIAKKEKFKKNPVNYAMRKAKLMKEKEIALAEHDNERADKLEEELQSLEQRAEELDKRRNVNTKFQSVSFINNRNRKNNVLKAEAAIAMEMKRKMEEGVEDNPFTRRKCNPRMVTKNVGQMDAEILKALAGSTEKENQKISSSGEADPKKRKLEDPANGAEGAASATPADSKKPKSGKDVSKEDIFDAHDFDIEIDVGLDMTGGGGASSSSVGTSNVAANASVKPPVSVAPKNSGPAKRSLNLADYKRKRGLI